VYSKSFCPHARFLSPACESFIHNLLRITRVICKINLNTSALRQLGNVREIFTEPERECPSKRPYRLRTLQSRKLQFDAHTRESKHVTAKRKEKRKRSGIKGRFQADGFLHFFCLDVFSQDYRASRELPRPMLLRIAPKPHPFAPVVDFPSATGIAWKSHPLFSQGAKDRPYENTLLRKSTRRFRRIITGAVIYSRDCTRADIFLSNRNHKTFVWQISVTYPRDKCRNFDVNIATGAPCLHV